MYGIRLRWVMTAALMMATTVHAADGGYDLSWGNSGRLTVDVSPLSNTGKKLLIQPDGKMVVAGNCGDQFCAIRLLPNGSYDTGFGPASHPGRVILNAPGDSIFSLRDAALRADGGLILVGTAAFGLSRQLVVMLLNAAGIETLRTFDFNFGDPYELEALAIQSDGKLVLAAMVFHEGRRVFAVSRLTSETEYDLSFGDHQTATKLIAFAHDSKPAAIAIQPDGKIVVVGVENNNVAAVRLLTNGQLDDDPVLGFGEGGRAVFDWGAPSAATAVLIDSDGSLSLAGEAFGGTGPVPSADFFVNRLTSRGAQHPDFGLVCPPPFCDPGPAYIAINLGTGNLSDEALAMALQPDGKILVSGLANLPGGQRFAVARLTPYGDPDFDFGNGGSIWSHFGAVASIDAASGIAVGNGGIMVAGYSREATGQYRFGIAKLLLRQETTFANGFE